MGASQSRAPYGSDARVPFILESTIVQGEIVGVANSNQAFRNTNPEHDVCAVCIGPMGRSRTFTLPQCGHSYHTLCLASALQVQQSCPICRVAVHNDVCHEIAGKLASDPQAAELALELIMDLRTRGNPLEKEVYDHDLIDALRAAAKKGDVSKIPSIATFLGKGAATVVRARQSPEVQIAALEALRALVPCFSADWPGLMQVLKLLREVVTEDRDPEVRVTALRAIREVSRPGYPGYDIMIDAVRQVLEEPKIHTDVKLEAGNTLRALARPGDSPSARAACIALTDEDAGVHAIGLSVLRSICRRGECTDLLSDFAEMATGSRSPDVRAAVLELIAQIEGEGGAFGPAVGAMALKDCDENVRMAALGCLRRVWRRGDGEAVAVLAQTVWNAEDPRLVRECLEALPRVAIRPSIAASRAAVDALASRNDSVRCVAAQVLRQLCDRGDKEILQRLSTLLDHQDDEVKRLAIEACAGIATPGDLQVKDKLDKLALGGNCNLEMVAENALRQIR